MLYTLMSFKVDPGKSLLTQKTGPGASKVSALSSQNGVCGIWLSHLGILLKPLPAHDS